MSTLVKQLVFCAALLSSLLLPATSMAGDTLDRVVDFKTLKIGMSGDQPPFSMVNRDGKLMGFDVDLALALAVALKVQPEIRKMPFGDLMAALENDEIDMVISGMAITPERARAASFVGPYMMSGKSILTRDSVLARVSEGEEFNRKDLRLAALKNSTSATFVGAVAPEATLVAVDTYEAAIAMLSDGKIDGLVADMPICMLTVLRNPDAGFVTTEKPLTVEPVGIAVKASDPQFHNLVDNYLEAYGKLGILAKLRAKWFESSDWIAALP